MRIERVSARAYNVPTAEADGTLAWDATTLILVEALWDLQGKLLGLLVALLLGHRREAAPIYGSGGFTIYTDSGLEARLSGWVERDGCAWVKMKIDTHPARDPHRVAAGAFSAKQALGPADRFARDAGVLWFEEPVSSDDLAGLHLHVTCAAPRQRHIERFHDRVRIEHMLFEGAPVPKQGAIRPDLSRPGLSLAFRHQDAEHHRAA